MTISRKKEWQYRESLSAGDLNAEFNNIIENLTPANMDDCSSNAALMQANTQPTEGSLPTTLTGEVERLRYAIKEIKGAAQWYTTPAIGLGINSGLQNVTCNLITSNYGLISVNNEGANINATNCDASSVNVTLTNLTITNIVSDVTISGNIIVEGEGTHAISNGFASEVFAENERVVTTDGSDPSYQGVVFSAAVAETNANNTSTGLNLVNGSATLTTTGRPVFIMLQGDGANEARFFTSASDPDKNNYCRIFLYRDTTKIVDHVVFGFADEEAGTTHFMEIPASSFKHIDMPPAGTYTYQVQLLPVNHSTGTEYVYANRLRLVAYEL